MSHSIIAPSGAGIWGKPGGCTKYPTMAAAFPEPPTEESREGDATHELGADMIRASATANINFPRREDVVDSAASNGFIFTDDMYDGAKIYADDVAEVMRDEAVFGGKPLGIEARIEAPNIHELSYGTTDCYIFAARTLTLYVWDFKFGHEVVEAFENWQSINYVAGLLDALGINGKMDQQVTVEIRICQPRAFHRDGQVRKWRIKASDLRAYFNILSGNAHKSLSADAEAVSGPHCIHCPGRHVCEAALSAGLSLYEAASKSPPLDISNEALSVLFSIVSRGRKHLEALEKGYANQIQHKIKSGESIPGYLVEMGRGREAWDRPVEEVIMLGDLLNKNLRKDGAITPKQARALGIDGDVISAYSKTPETGLRVVKDDGSKARFIFSSN